MVSLVKQIVALKSKIGRKIKNTLRSFKKNIRLNSEQKFLELCFCILVANTSLMKTKKIWDEINKGFIYFSKNSLKRKLKKLGYRFYNKRTNYIVFARKFIKEIDAELKNKNELKAGNIMTKKLIYVNADDSITSAINKMRKHEISQLPVFNRNNVVGLVSESTILDSISSKSPEEIKKLTIKDIMQDCPPIVSKKTSTSIISGLLKYYPIVLVTEEGKPKGVITKSDMLRTLYKG